MNGRDPGRTRQFGWLRTWAWVHKWTSLLCTVFLLLICVTGLPLVFAEEIDGWLDPHSYESLPSEAPRVSLDHLLVSAGGLYPQQIITSVFIDDDEPQTLVWMAPSWAALRADDTLEHFIRFDSRTGKVLEQSKPPVEQHRTFLGVMLSLHRDLFAGLPGELFMGVMGLLFVIAVVSGVVLYAPFARKVPFGTVRRGRTPRLQWLDLHNLLGIVTLLWTFLLGATGVMNELSTPLFGLWRLTEVQAVLRPWQGQPSAPQSQLASVQTALETARRAVPGMLVTSITYPGAESGSAHHFLFWAHGATAWTRRLFSPVLVDAATGQLTAVVAMPWYLRALEISRPLHFGDYGGLPLKIIWALLDLVTIVVLGSGVYLWLGRRRSPIERRLAALMPPPASTLPSSGMHELAE